jgi:hypothetical protein
MTRGVHIETYLFHNFETVLGNIPEGSSEYLDLLSYYAVLKAKEYERWGILGDLEEAIRRAGQAVGATTDDHPGRAGSLNNLGNNLQH